MYSSKITREEIGALPLVRYEGPVRIIWNDAGAREAVAALRRERVLGFDTETRAAFRKGESYPPALVQLAASGAVYLFRLGPLRGLGGLDAIFADPAIIKAGVSIRYDIKKLKEVRDFCEAGFVEIEKLTDAASIESNGLQALAAIVLGFRISKRERRTNWSLPRLTRRQIAYAATDAWVCREIYGKLEGEGLMV